MGFFDVLFGTPQSLYASYAIIAALITICITAILIRTDLTVANRFLFVFLVILMLIPSIVLTLFQLTCMVTGGSKDERWWCWLYAWIVSVFIIIYCIFVIIISFMTLFNYNSAINKVEVQEKLTMISPSDSNDIAKSILNYEGFANKDDNEDKKPLITPPDDLTDSEPKLEHKKKTKEEEPKEKKIISKFTNPNVDLQEEQNNLNELLMDEEFEGFANYNKNYSKY